MARAVAGLSVRPDFALIDGRDVPDALFCPARAIVDGDALSLSIAAASIVAKVARDRLMARLDLHFPGYGFSRVTPATRRPRIATRWRVWGPRRCIAEVSNQRLTPAFNVLL